MPTGRRRSQSDSNRAISGAKPTRGRKREPLEMRMTLVVRTGERPEDQLTLMDNRKLYMLGSVFEHRMRIQRYFVTSLLKVATRSPRAFSEIAPGLRAVFDTVRRSGRRGSKK